MARMSTAGQKLCHPRPQTNRTVNDKQLALLKQLLWAVANDPVAIADLDSYGKAHEHLSQLMADHCIEQLSLSPRDLHPSK